MTDDNVSTKRPFGPSRFLNRGAKDEKKAKAYKRAPKQEKAAAVRLGGRQTAASGARFYKGDVKVPGLARIECKCTGADSFRVTREMLDTIERAGLLNDEIPFIEVEFIDPKSGKTKDRVCVLRQSALTGLLNRLKDAEGPPPERSVGRAKPHRHRIGKID
jgi:hypothetical protein